MSWITIVWSMNAAACLTLAGIYLLVWCKQREDWVPLVFSVTAVAGAALTAFELALLCAQTTAQYAALLRWVQLPVWVVVVSLVLFVRLYLRAGRAWLAWSVCGIRTLALILNFIFIPNLSYRQITSLRQVVWWGGETVSVPVGVTNPWVLVAQLSLLLLVIFFVDAASTAWRRGDRQRALVVGGALILFSAIAVGHVVLVVWGIIQTPYLACFAFLGLIAAMGYQMSSDMLQRTQLARQLEANEADLREANQRMELAASAAELGMWMWDIVRDEIWITDKGRTLFGLAPSEKLDFNRFRNMLHPEDRESVLQLLENSLRTGAEYRSEYRAVLPNGQIRWIGGRGHVEFDGDGQPVRMRGCSLDITKRRRAEEELRMGEAALRESKERIDLATKAAGLVVWTWDIPRDEVWLSNKDRALFGFSQGEKLTAERIRSVVHPEDRQLVRQLSEDALRTGEEIETQYRVLLPDGRVRWVTRRGRVEFDADGKPFRERGVLMDITKRKQAELEAARQRNELAHLSRVTTMGELSGSLAHELNRPLGAILSNAQAAQRMLANGGVDVAEFREILNDIVSENKHAAEVIRRLRLWLQKREVQQHSLHINKVVRDVLKLIRTDLISQNVSVDTELARNLPIVTGDPVQLQQVLVNLVVNACDAMADCDTRERRLRIRTGLENGGGAVIVSVTDGGGGIQVKEVEQMFEPFFTTKAKGMGLGLSVCRTLIAAHRGKLWATNNAERGATFHFTLPKDSSAKPRTDNR